jgi:tetratricopeptide (TPR) repeat protein
VAYHYLGVAYTQKKMYKEAIDAFQRSHALSGGGGAYDRSHLGYVYAVSGETGKAERVIEELKRESSQSHVSPWGIALIYTGLGDKDRAFEWLDKAYEARAFDLQYLKVDPRFEGLRSDSRFQKLLRRMGLVL